MNRKTFALVFITLAFISLASIAQASSTCPICGVDLDEEANTACEITFTSGQVSVYCCPHCGLWEQITSKGRIAGARARDFITGQWRDVSTMFYLGGSSATPSCTPSWIAFARKADAEKFRKAFGGTILSYDDALAVRANQPKSSGKMK